MTGFNPEIVMLQNETNETTSAHNVVINNV